jgi:phage terminase large subunit-like protein
VPGRPCDRCPLAGPHICQPRARRVLDVFRLLLVHTKGRWARLAFQLAAWQRQEIIVPLFGFVEWSGEAQRWVRVYWLAWLEVARKNGKSELLAGIALVLLCADDEEGAEVYGCARDRDQARKVYDVAERMVDLSPVLSRRLKVYRQNKRIVDERTGSYYEIVAADAPGNLGHNPHGVLFDEVLTQPSRELWDAFWTGWGTRDQALMVAATTAGEDPVGLCATEHDFSERVLANPALDRHRLVFMRNVPVDADWTDPKVWKHANPALGSFLSLRVLRAECKAAVAAPEKQRAFRQYRCNTWGLGSVSRWVPLEAWDATAGLVVPEQLHGRRGYGGLDLASTTDLAAWCLTFPDGAEPEGYDALWRFWAPEARRGDLDARTGGQASVWARQGFLTFTPGDVIDYHAIEAAIDADARAYDVAEIAFDPWGMTQLSQDLAEAGMTVVDMRQGFGSMSPPTREWEVLIRQGRYRHGGNPVMRWMFDNVRMRSDHDGNVKIDRGRSADKVDGCVAAVMALDRAVRRQAPTEDYTAAGF